MVCHEGGNGQTNPWQGGLIVYNNWKPTTMANKQEPENFPDSCFITMDPCVLIVCQAFKLQYLKMKLGENCDQFLCHIRYMASQCHFGMI